MDPAKIALQRRISSDSVDSFGVAHHRRNIRKGRRKPGNKRSPQKTNICAITGDDLRSPPSPESDSPRHSDRAPDKRVRSLRDDAPRGGKKRSLKSLARRTRSLSPQVHERQRFGKTELLRWKPVELLEAAGQAKLPSVSQRDKDPNGDQENKESDEKELACIHFFSSSRWVVMVQTNLGS